MLGPLGADEPVRLAFLVHGPPLFAQFVRLFLAVDLSRAHLPSESLASGPGGLSDSLPDSSTLLLLLVLHVAAPSLGLEINQRSGPASISHPLLD